MMSGQANITSDVRLTTTVGPTSAAGTVTSIPAGINCTPDCWESYSPGTTVTLTATPNEGWVFDHWRGDCSGAATTSVTLDYNKVCDAIFKRVEAPKEETPPQAANENNNDETALGGSCCAPAGSEISYALCEVGGDKCCVTLTHVECSGMGGKYMDTATCKAAPAGC